MFRQFSRRVSLSLIIPCYNEAETLDACIRRTVELQADDLDLEIIIVDDGSTDQSVRIAHTLSREFQCVRIIEHDKNYGKGRALRTGIAAANTELIGIQDADLEYDPLEYRILIGPILDGRADIVYGSRFLRMEERRVLYFWHSWMNRALTTLSNMFTNLDLTDMETCYKLFRREVIQSINLKEDRFGFEPEVTIKIAERPYRVYECAISYRPRSYEEGKKIGWKDGLRALYCILHYGGSSAPLPMQLMIYFFIGLLSAIGNLIAFSAALGIGTSLTFAIISSFILAAAVNYILCILILFKHKARWSTTGELIAYIITLGVMGLFDYGLTIALVNLGFSTFVSKLLPTIAGFFGNFLLRRLLVFPKRRSGHMRQATKN